jgi:hypothetical protein
MEPDANLMEEVEALLGWEGSPDEFRRGLLSKFAAWTLDHPNDPIENHVVFADHIHKLRAAVYAKLRKPVGELCRDMVDYVRGNGAKVPEDRKTEIRRALDAMRDQFGYCDHCASDAAAMLVRKRFHDIIV